MGLVGSTVPAVIVWGRFPTCEPISNRLPAQVHKPARRVQSCPTSQGTLKRYTEYGRVEMSTRRYPVVIEQTTTGYSAYSPDVAGCAAVGDREEETRQNFQDALIAHFEAMREVGEPIPEPHTSVDYVEVAAGN